MKPLAALIILINFIRLDVIQRFIIELCLSFSKNSEVVMHKASLGMMKTFPT